MFGIAGFILPTLFLIAAIPVLVATIGREGFGIFFFAASLSGTIALLDIGIGNASVRYIAADLGQDLTVRAGSVITASVLFYGALGLVGATTIWILAPWLSATFGGTSIPREETERAFRLSALQMIPGFGVASAIAIFKGMQRFGQVASVVSIIAAGTYGGAILAAKTTEVSLSDISAISLAANCVALAYCVAIGWLLCRRREIPVLNAFPSIAVYRRLFRFGIFMTLNSMAAFFLYQVQRYLIGAFLGPSALAAYHIAHTVPSKAHALVNSGAEVLFPRASAIGGNADLRRMYVRVFLLSLGLASLVLVPLWIFGEQLLRLWVGNELAHDANEIMPAMIVGFFMIALSPAPFHVVNGINRPELNTMSWVLCAMLNILLIGWFALDGLTLKDFAYAFAIANVISGVAFQAYVEVVLWREMKNKEPVTRSQTGNEI